MSPNCANHTDSHSRTKKSSGPLSLLQDMKQKSKRWIVVKIIFFSTCFAGCYHHCFFLKDFIFILLYSVLRNDFLSVNVNKCVTNFIYDVQFLELIRNLQYLNVTPIHWRKLTCWPLDAPCHTNQKLRNFILLQLVIIIKFTKL